MPSQKRKLGDLGEKEAENFLEKNGYKIIAKNYRVKNLGEIDIIGEKKDKLYFFEVKTRKAKHIANFPIEYSINEKKRRNLNKICQTYLLEKKHGTDKKWQVDAIFVKINEINNNFIIERLENILWEKYY
jgi:putative endonuclease